MTGRSNWGSGACAPVDWFTHERLQRRLARVEALANEAAESHTFIAPSEVFAALRGDSMHDDVWRDE